MSVLNILVVEDDPATLKLVEKRLKKADYEVETAKSGVEAVGLISERFFDVVITDLIMPGGVDGIGVLEVTKSKWNRTEVIILTGHASVNNAVEAMKKGAINYLEKPVNFDELLLQLQNISTLKSLSKDASDLREAMDTTEKNAAKTIQDLEIMVSNLQQKCSKINEIVGNDEIDADDRMELVLKIMSSDS